MRIPAARIFCMALAGLLAPSVQALTVYRCTGADGAIAFQDRPCPRSGKSQRVELPDESAPKAAPAPDFSRPEPAPTTRSPPQALAPMPAATQPFAIVCTREDGSRYLSASGHGDRRAVPLAMLGLPSQTLSEAYGGPNGIGVSAPGLREAPTDRSGRAAAGSLYTWVEDPCERLAGSAYCAFLDSRIGDAERRLRLAFSDRAPEIRTEIEALRRRAEACQR